MSNAKPKKGRLKLLLLAVIFLTPILGSYVAYYVWQPKGRVNFGELVVGYAVPEMSLASAHGGMVPLQQLRGKWLLVQIDDAACLAACQNKLYALRQARLIQGKHQDRIERLWLVDSERMPTSTPVGVWTLNAYHNPILNSFPVKTTARDHIYVVDPLGNVVLRYSGTPQPAKMAKDLKRLLQASRIG